MSLPERIRLLRLQRGYSQENLAYELGLSTTAYGDIERGKTDLTLSRLNQLAKVLRVAPTELLTGEGLLETTRPIAEVTATSAENHEAETLRLRLEKQQLEIEKLRLEADYWKRRYETQVAQENARLLAGQPPRERIGF
jgi:XRE family transcriptional regulator, regulator of sulfur utilization